MKINTDNALGNVLGVACLVLVWALGFLVIEQTGDIRANQKTILHEQNAILQFEKEAHDDRTAKANQDAITRDL